MALAGRFMTKCEMVLGIVMILGFGVGAEEYALRGLFVGMVILLASVRAKCRTSDAAW
jgi:hypothetical protein